MFDCFINKNDAFSLVEALETKEYVFNFDMAHNLYLLTFIVSLC